MLSHTHTCIPTHTPMGRLAEGQTDRRRDRQTESGPHRQTHAITAAQHCCNCTGNRLFECECVAHVVRNMLRKSCTTTESKTTTTATAMAKKRREEEEESCSNTFFSTLCFLFLFYLSFFLVALAPQLQVSFFLQPKHESSGASGGGVGEKGR